ncbi:MAG: ABC transporter ATP-binding protein [Chloroflexi bacterium]|nr:ABC transporter ATP-binding protein [Chloroflexota bacterium]
MLISVRDLNVSYGKVPVLHAISFDVAPDETVAIIGPNGAGKSTLLKTIAGMVHPVSGAIILNGKEIGGLTADQVVREKVAYVPEGGRVFPNMTVMDNLRMGAYSCRDNLKAGVLDEMYELFPILKQRSSQYARTLSGGERQMLAIARGLVSRPKLLMLDEPSLGVGPKLVDEIYSKIQILIERGMTVLLVEQNTSYALQIANRGYVLENGHSVLAGSAEELSCSDHVRKHYLGL